jgi:hypothetical protein
MKVPAREEIRHAFLTRVAADLDLLRRRREIDPYGYATACCDVYLDGNYMGRLCNQLGGTARNYEYDPRPWCDHRHHDFELWLA